MKIKLDENLSFRIADLLKNFGHNIQSLHDERLIGHADWEIGRLRSYFKTLRKVIMKQAI
jgi:predicted nuclease of predicted toxin-antitoxin system